MRAFMLGGLMALALSGCSVVGIDNATEGDLREKRSAWLAQNQRNYTYEYERLCYCVDVRPVVVTVKNDVVTSVVVKETGEPVARNLSTYMTITQLYDYLIDAADRADEMSVRFDNAWHIPSFADIDFEAAWADDELRLNVRNLVLTGP